MLWRGRGKWFISGISHSKANMDLKSESGPRWEAQFSFSKLDVCGILKELDIQAHNRGRIVGRQTEFQFPVHGPECTGRIWGLIPQPRQV